ncbi:uncharacterized protein LOC129572925 [Sitodiplosis mosellana]|uniref:uncharacterized protein LOC129572925 n=1 Tax=Sitodiplosis mosellana TaxID=263140 RepID=UPI0024452FCA|nr:uncharacterized protein LOC129572925 [Sitodiplosis mosellana]
MCRGLGNEVFIPRYEDDFALPPEPIDFDDFNEQRSYHHLGWPENVDNNDRYIACRMCFYPILALNDATFRDFGVIGPVNRIICIDPPVRFYDNYILDWEREVKCDNCDGILSYTDNVPERARSFWSNHYAVILNPECLVYGVERDYFEHRDDAEDDIDHDGEILVTINTVHTIDNDEPMPEVIYDPSDNSDEDWDN